MKKKNKPENPPEKKKKKHRLRNTLLVLLLIAVITAAVLFYLYLRQQPEKALKEYLSCVRDMDFEGMTEHLQSSDLSALDQADIRDEAYADFFKTNSRKITYKILKNSFHIGSGTAEITVLLQYVDGSELYQESMTEFLRQMVSSAFSGRRPSEEEARQMLSTILMEKARSAQDVFRETRITYPLIQIGQTWKVVSLDEETVRIMSSNFLSAKEEINQTLEDVQGSPAAQETGIPSPTTVPETEPQPDLPEEEEPAPEPEVENPDVIHLDTDVFAVSFTQYRVSEDFGGNPCVIFYYDYTNKGSVPSSAMVDVRIQAYQNDHSLEAAVLADQEEAADRYMAEIQPGETANVCQAFLLEDESDVTVLAEESFLFGEGDVSSQILKIREDR